MDGGSASGILVHRSVRGTDVEHAARRHRRRSRPRLPGGGCHSDDGRGGSLLPVERRGRHADSRRGVGESSSTEAPRRVGSPSRCSLQGNTCDAREQTSRPEARVHQGHESRQSLNRRNANRGELSRSTEHAQVARRTPRVRATASRRSAELDRETSPPVRSDFELTPVGPSLIRLAQPYGSGPRNPHIWTPPVGQEQRVELQRRSGALVYPACDGSADRFLAIMDIRTPTGQSLNHGHADQRISRPGVGAGLTGSP